MRKMRRWLRVPALLMAAALWLSVTAWADGGAQVISASAQGEEGVLYLDPDGAFGQISVQVGQTVCPEPEVTTLSELETPLETVILVDNSQSVPEKMRELTRSLLMDLVGSRMDRERVSIGTVGDGVSWLCEGTTEYATLKTAVEGLEYYNQNTYLTGAIYETIAGTQGGGDGVLRRLVVIADGENATSLSCTWNEVETLACAAGWPVYAVVLTSNAGGAEQVREETAENLFALARATGASAVAAADETDSLEVVAQITQINSAVRVSFPLLEALCDGMERAVEVTITRDGGESERVMTQMTMPMRAADGETEAPATEPEMETETEEPPAPEAETPSEPETEAPPSEPETEEPAAPEEETPETVPEETAGNGGEAASAPGVPTVLLAVVLVLAVAAILAAVLRRKPAAGGGARGSVSAPAPDPEEGETVTAAGNLPMRIRLTDCQQPERRFDLPLDRPITVGRGSSRTVNLHGEERVSRDQCVIFRQGARVILQNHSQHGTRVEGRLLYGSEQCELTDGSIITLGEVLSLRVELL